MPSNFSRASTIFSPAIAASIAASTASHHPSTYELLNLAQHFYNYPGYYPARYSNSTATHQIPQQLRSSHNGTNAASSFLPAASKGSSAIMRSKLHDEEYGYECHPFVGRTLLELHQLKHAALIDDNKSPTETSNGRGVVGGMEGNSYADHQSSREMAKANASQNIISNNNVIIDEDEEEEDIDVDDKDTHSSSPVRNETTELNNYIKNHQEGVTEEQYRRSTSKGYPDPYHHNQRMINGSSPRSPIKYLRSHTGFGRTPLQSSLMESFHHLSKGFLNSSSNDSISKLESSDRPKSILTK